MRKSYASSGFDLKAELQALSARRLKLMAEAGRTALECEAALAETGDNVVSELLRGRRGFFEWEHYPKDDVIDRRSLAQFYYHAHPKRERPFEHGHFHLFQRARSGADATHLVAISMDRRGRAIALFATNRWVTDEAWRSASDAIRLLDRFVVRHARPSWPVNRWVGAMAALFRPQIVALLRERDRVIAAWPKQGRTPVFEDRSLEVTGTLAIDLERQIRAVRAAISDRGQRRASAARPGSSR